MPEAGAPSWPVELAAPVAAILDEALRAPSAHNAQPWRLVQTGAATVELHYDHLDYLPFDPDDRDAYLALGAFYETLSLAAHRHGHRADLSPRFERDGSDLWVGDIVIRPAGPDDSPDPLAPAVADRHTNRRPYDKTPVPAALGAQLAGHDYETVAGLIFTTLGRVPRVGTVVTKNGWRFDVDRADRRRIYRVKVSPDPAWRSEEEEEEEARS